ncbi:mitochondrial 37S ribosomal protein mS23 [Lodderomyces beijingensis]|uniref:37S ribosomal protein S25, mitochondrial n=1 Tax=Lodderomyces beijingensis TaxID=1775926 RepID=A0ABP0ZFZ6_9ASCO
MKIQKDAINVLARASSYLQSGVLTEKPLWFDIVAKYPPTHNLIKRAYVQQEPQENDDPRSKLLSLQKPIRELSHDQVFKTRSTKNERANRNREIHRIPKLQFLEDEIRNYFHQQHPWEFARPKNLIENSGDEIGRKCNWSHMLQLHKPLDGESVVQRTIYILTNDPDVNDVFQAYDKARFEFYKLRMREEMESHISKEESMMHGCVFESTNMSWNLANEQNYINDWVELASEETKIMDASASRSSAPAGSLVGGEEGTSSSLFEDLLSSSPTQKDGKAGASPDDQKQE